jgi:hypothetical protein
MVVARFDSFRAGRLRTAAILILICVQMQFALRYEFDSGGNGYE